MYYQTDNIWERKGKTFPGPGNCSLSPMNNSHSARPEPGTAASLQFYFDYYWELG